MLKKKSLNKRIMTGIRCTLILSTFVVCMMDIIIENQLNLMYIFANSMILYSISDSGEE